MYLFTATCQKFVRYQRKCWNINHVSLSLSFSLPSLHKSLSQEADLRDQFNNTIGSFEEEAQVRCHALGQMQKTNSQLNAQLKQQQNERNAMAAQLQQALIAQQNSQTKLKE